MTQGKCAVILAAGEGKRMKSDIPKVMCEVLFKPMLGWVIDAAYASGISDICVVVGYENETVLNYIKDRYFSDNLNITFAIQNERLGTGHAVSMATDFLNQHKDDNVLILCGDAPFVDSTTIERSSNIHADGEYAATVLSANLADPTGYGRVVRVGNNVSAIVEHRDADEKTLKICEVNSGTYWFRCKELLDMLSLIKNNNSQKEYYLTDAISILIGQNKNVGSYLCRSSDTTLGANDRRTVQRLNEIARNNIIDNLLDDGVEIICRDGIIISPDVKVGAGTVILPGTILRGSTAIGRGCTIGPNSMLSDCIVGDNTVFNASQGTQSTIGSNVRFGPFSQLRAGCSIADGAKIGDFVEVKNSVIGEKTSIAHLTYIGDSDVGDEVNFGCGVVTVNYDGVKKSRTIIGNNAFIGCNTNLIAPVAVGNNAYTAAGTTITDDVPDGALAIGRVRQQNKEVWGSKKLSGKKKKKKKS